MSRRTQAELDELDHLAIANARQEIVDEMNRALNSARCRRRSTVAEDDDPWLGLATRAFEEALSGV